MMRLQSLELSGFKSFAKKTTLQFPDPITAIVGPNGAGKSNIAEAIRWVLGEQSMKSLRGKRGEDLLFHGSATLPRMGKASVNLHFDNHDGGIPLDFETVAISRKIFRDGTNEYALNGSLVRLKDVVELIAKMGLGESKHNIISQGEVDRFLAAGPRERREFLEEALGLRLPQLKKREAERKLGETLENTRQVESLLREIRPHLKFLKSQADKAERREAVGRELENHYRAYIRAEARAIDAEAGRLDETIAPTAAKLKELEAEIHALRRRIGSGGGDGADAQNLDAKERELETLESKRQGLERELGRIEGRLEAAPGGSGGEQQTIPLRTLEAKLKPIIREARQALSLQNLGELKERVRAALDEVEKLIIELSSPRGASEPGRLAAERAKVQGELNRLNQNLGNVRRELAEGLQALREAQGRMRGELDELRAREAEAHGLRVTIERHSFERERIELRRGELERIVAESGLDRKDREVPGTPGAADASPEELRKKIERSKVRLEEIGGIDPAVLKEYRDTCSRYDFLDRELSDLTAACHDLKKLIAELGERIERDFKRGFEEVKREFHNYFRIIFGGGRGSLAYQPLREHSAESGETEAGTAEGAAALYGIDIEVDLPRKRVKGLSMLSGGERALVSIALLFAITAVNPPPFLVLDETDASLDEANSQKYAAILRELSKKTQLILITHNRETMKVSGILYGATMGEDGISKLLSLKLEEAESYGNR